MNDENLNQPVISRDLGKITSADQFLYMGLGNAAKEMTSKQKEEVDKANRLLDEL